MERKNEISSRRRDNSISVYFSKEVKEELEDLAEKLPNGYSKSSLIEDLVEYALDDIRRVQSKPLQLKYLLSLLSQNRVRT